ncbi:Transposon Ty3-G Gag-Pol poly, partial [Paramuricea clavata]
AKTELDQMLSSHTVCKSSSNWASPLHMVPKSNGDWRPCRNYRALNAATKPYRYPVPHVQDYSARPAGCKIFSKIDLVRAYHQIPVAPEDVSKTAVVTPLGVFEFKRSPYGLRNAAQTFQRFIDEVYRDLDFVFVFIDDILVFSTTPDQHRHHLRQLFQRLEHYGLVINPKKCELCRSQLSFLGFPQPVDKKDFLNLLTRRKCEEAFQFCKSALASATLLVHPHYNAPTSITSDASDLAVGAVKTPSWFIEGRVFHVYTDHKPLTFAISSGSSQRSPRQIRQLAFISEFTTDLRHVKSKNNAVADAFSRIQINATSYTQIGFLAIAQAQADDYEIQCLKAGVTNLKLVDVLLDGDDNITLLCDSSQGNIRLVVPESFCREIFNLIHNLSHPDARSTCKLVSARCMWNGLNRGVRRWIRTRNGCQQSKIHRHTTAPLQKFDIPDHSFAETHVDIVGPLPLSRGFSYLFTCINRYTRWTEAIPMVDMTAGSCARGLLHGWILRFGLHRSIMSDRGRRFESNLWASLMLLLGIKRNRTTAYHPQSNGIVERFHRQLKTSVKALLNGPNWHDEVKSPLQRPYDGPFLVIQRNDKFFTLNKNGCRDTVSIDRFKPAFLEKMDDPPLNPTTHPMTPVPPDTIEPPLPMVLPTPSLTTRSGRTVHLPRRYRTGEGGAL